MENKLTNDEINKVFHLYWGTTKAQIKDTQPWIYDDTKYCVELGAKLLLKNIASISDEDAVEVAKFCFTGVVNYFQLAQIGRDYIDYIFLEKGLTSRRSEDIGQFDVKQIYQYLISKGYDVPLYFSPNHWANGKTAIELGLAIEPL